MGIIYDGNTTGLETNLSFRCFSDAAYADDPETRKSTEAYLFKLLGGAIDWTSRKQRTVTTSTTEDNRSGVTSAPTYDKGIDGMGAFYQ